MARRLTKKKLCVCLWKAYTNIFFNPQIDLHILHVSQNWQMVQKLGYLSGIYAQMFANKHKAF